MRVRASELIKRFLYEGLLTYHSPPAGKIKILVLYTWLYSSTFIFYI
jgi:hypothetical protein